MIENQSEKSPQQTDSVRNDDNLKQYETTVIAGIHSGLIEDDCLQLNCLKNSRKTHQKVSSKQFEIDESYDVSVQKRMKIDINSCHHMKHGLDTTLDQSEKDLLLPSKIVGRQKLCTSLNNYHSAYSFAQPTRRRYEKKKMYTGLVSPTFLKRRSRTSVFLPPAVLLDSQAQNSIPKALAHLPITEKVHIFNRKTGRIMNDIPISELPSLLRDHAEYEPIYFDKNEKKSNALYRASRTSPGGRVSVEVQPQPTLFYGKKNGNIVLVIKGVFKGAWGRIVSNIPGNWLIIRRCFSFDGNDNLNMIVHTKSVKIISKHQDQMCRREDEGNAIHPTQNMKLTAQKKVSEMEEKIENLEKTISSNNSIHEDNELKRQLVAAKDQFEVRCSTENAGRAKNTE